MTDDRGTGREHLIRQRHALADFGQHALMDDDLDAILQRACELVAEGCSTKLAKVLEHVAADRVLLVRAGVGWRPGIVGQVRIPTHEESAAGHALVTGKAVTSADLENETRFRVSEFVREHGVVSVANVLIGTPGGDPFGVLEVDSTVRREFSQDDIDFLQTYAHLIGAAVDRHRRNRLLEETLQQREVLMRELQHRVKNNLQVITSLLSIQRRRTDSPEVVRELDAIRNRIEALRLLHDKLYAAGTVRRIELRSYLGELASNLIEFHHEEAQSVRLETSLARMVVDADMAIPLALIVNEFITNSVKYAFDGEGIVSVELAVVERRHARLVLRDNGKGIPNNRRRATRGTGMNLIAMLAQQIGATESWKSDKGTELTLLFPL
jgi:two-component sensor histidine kinase